MVAKPWQVALRLAGLVDHVTVVDPPEARAELARVAVALAARYAGVTPAAPRL